MNKTKLKRSYICAINGLFKILIREQNIKIHLIVAVIIVIAMIFYQFSRIEAAIVVAFITLVFLAEIFNTVLEKLIDKLHPNFDEKVGRIKDAMAGAVLISVIMSVIVGTVIFWPHLQNSVLNATVGMIIIITIMIIAVLSAII